MMMNVIDPEFNGPGSEGYRAEVFPELWPHAPRQKVEQWPEEDRLAWCGGAEFKEAVLNGRY
jgi:Phage gene product 52